MATLIDKINQNKNLFLVEIGETEEKATVRVVLCEGEKSEPAKDVAMFGLTESAKEESAAFGKIFKGSRLITPTGPTYELVFRGYIGYSVTNESYSKNLESEKYVGNVFRVYSQSCFLDYIKASTIATKEYPGEYTHYCLVCCDHIIDVVSTEKPVIKERMAVATRQ